MHVLLIIMFKSGLYQLKAFFSKSKRVINIPRATLESTEQPKQKQLARENVYIDAKKLGWENMDLSELSSLNQAEIEQIKYSLKKFKTNTSISNLLPEQQENKLKQHLKTPYQYLTNQKSHPKIQAEEIVEIYDFNLEISNSSLVSLIQFVYKNIHMPTSLYGKVETSFIQQIIALSNDLKRVGKQLKSIDAKVVSLKPIKLNYQFCVDVSKNRNKNQSIQHYSISQQSMINPNDSLLMKEHHGKQIVFKSIVKKRRSINYKSVLRINSLLEVVFEDGKQHYIKIQFEGPKAASSKNIQYPQTIQYQIIDIDEIMKGNPSIKAPFNF